METTKPGKKSLRGQGMQSGILEKAKVYRYKLLNEN